MCGVCGCGEGPNHSHEHDHDHQHGHAHEHRHVHAHSHSQHRHHHEHAHSPEHAHAPGLTPARMVQIEQDILSANNRYADDNRRYFGERGMLALNLVSSPGSGKTTLLTETILRLKDALNIAVIEGDQQTARDADRIRATGVPAVQINTGKGCHLDAHRVGHALESLNLPEKSMLFIENVGNLVCPSAFDLGEAHKVVILSVTEGEDKPIKYPDMFHAADLMILNKTDLLPYLDFDVEQCIRYAKQVNPKIRVLQLSAKTGAGMDNWLKWLRAELDLQGIGYA
ncbi:hydrogenase nickel incorporation protein HypB [Methylomonas koyamae]|uniref:hydrogenase nickel incorporation protein HypB n=1 Tax=Methylomonas koyamae TaxID=702114 RepID=UPI002873298F|nr:hydrogenase nickel incorporation protein HypB [Methylomonas koyamae]WNB75418.1 hydrogenase nickel incorporation protein HypB [Methylomonas koyamae]